MINFPEPNAIALQHSQQLQEFIFAEIESNGGQITFARFMELALYAPGLGYYSAGAQKFGDAGDFVTAPEISPLFAQCLARQCQQVLSLWTDANILELGAGSGKMAVDLLLELERLNTLPQRYLILEVSAELRQRQHALFQAQIPHLLARVEWLEHLPVAASFTGIILGNEVIDALPVHRFHLDNSNNIQEFYVARAQDKLMWQLDQPSSSELIQHVQALSINHGSSSYESEINVLLPAWLNSLSACLKRGVILLIDYGFPQQEYYHPERSMGTLMCHYRHRAHDDPLMLVGLQDITVHVDFTAVAESAVAAGLQVAGYTTQAAFLLSCGLLELPNLQLDDNIRERVMLNQQVQKLTSPSEMGELFKVIALTRGMDDILLGFSLRDQRGRL